MSRSAYFAGIWQARSTIAATRPAAPPQISLWLAVALAGCFGAFGLAAGVLVGLIYDAPALTAAVLALSSGLALRRRRS